MKLFGKSMFSRHTAPLTVPLVLFFFLPPLAIGFTWISVVVPHLSAYISPLEDSHPFTCSILQTSIRVMFLPAIFVPQFLMIHFYQRYYDRKKRGHDAA
jgi:hypothetical protein